MGDSVNPDVQDLDA
jgi:hypothetical protein